MTDTPIDPTLPEVVQKFLASGAKLEHIRLDKFGQWWHRGIRFENQKIARLFSRSVGRTEGGTWVLNVGRFTYPIDVEDTGLFVERWQVDPAGGITLTLSDESTETLLADTLRFDPDGGLLCAVKAGKFDARFLKTPYYHLADHIDEKNGSFVLKVGAIDTIIPEREAS